MKRIFVLINFVVFLLVSSQSSFAEGKGICSKCHVKTEKMDVRLITEAMHHKHHPDLNKLGADFKIDEWTVNECLTCHASSKSRIAFKKIIHKIHLTSKHFTPAYSGTCVTCHVMTKSGEMAIRDTVSAKETVTVSAETLTKAPFLGKK